MSAPKIVALIGTYRKFGIIDQAVDAVLKAAAEAGAETRKIYLIDQPIEFCQNCRMCTQEEGVRRGKCVKDDNMAQILDEVDAADALVLAAPVNIGDVTAITRRFMERMVCYTYWPWGAKSPEPRIKQMTKRALLITSTAMPTFFARFFTRSMRTLKEMAKLVGAKPFAEFYIGEAAQALDQQLRENVIRTARLHGKRLVKGNRKGRSK